MIAFMDPHAITTLEQLREVYPPPAERSVRKELDRLDEHCRRFIALCPFALLASANAQGACDVSPKGGPAGFVTVLDDHRLLIPDATGNRRLDSLQNLLENPRVGLLFLIPGMGETLRINGRVELTRDPVLLQGLQTGGRSAALGLLVTVEQAYLHCAKSILRSGLWRTETWAQAEELPSAAEILNDHIGIGDVAASAAALADSYANRI
jgi:PPOX class probable FMN-dependent enzyme